MAQSTLLRALDWSLIVALIMSFAAIVHTYDAISGEQEDGTLRLLLASSVSRGIVLFSKAVGAFTSLMLPLAMGVCIHLLILTVLGSVSLEAAHWVRIGIFLLLAGLYTSVFVALGLLISTWTRQSATSLVVLLLIWVVAVLIVPNTGELIIDGVLRPMVERSERVPLLAKLTHPVKPLVVRLPTERQVLAEASRKKWETGIGSGRWSPGESLSLAIRASNLWNRTVDDYRLAAIHRMETIRAITRLSPTALFRDTSETLAGTGITHHRRFFDQVRRYRSRFQRVLQEAYPGDRDDQPWEQWGRKVRQIRLRPEQVPLFKEQPPSLTESTAAIQLDVLVFALLGSLCFSGAFARFARMDIA